MTLSTGFAVGPSVCNYSEGIGDVQDLNSVHFLGMYTVVCAYGYVLSMFGVCRNLL